jgi:gamma-glutamyltranspeptidase/glutathione hydrolase
MTTRSILRPQKDEVVVENGAVTTTNPLASKAGLEILKQGGNAVDAAVATGFCLAVVEPWGSTIAGHGQFLVYMAEKGRAVAIDFSHRSPLAASADMFTVLGQAESGNGIYEVEGDANALGPLAVGVPGVTAGLCKAHSLFGRLPLEQLLEPAVHHAQGGFQPDATLCLQIAEAMPEFAKYGEGARVFLTDGYPPKQGIDKVFQRDLADTLKRIAREGGDALYKGDIPHAIDEYMRRNGGLLGARDFTDFDVQVSEPARTSYRGYEILGSPVPGGGTTEMQLLRILDNFDLKAAGHNTPEGLHLVIEASRHAFADRYRYLGDPDFLPVPLAGMLSRRYAEEIAKLIDSKRASLEDDREKQPWIAFADLAIHDPWPHDPHPGPEAAPNASPPSEGDCTTHYGTVDRDRNIVASTQTAVGGFGSRVVVPGTGIVLTNGIKVFNPMPGAANSIAGYKRGLSNMGPLIVLRDGKPYLSVGAPGGRKIMNRIPQIVMNVIDHGMGIQQALTAPTIDAADRETFVDQRIDESVADSLRAMGHNIEHPAAEGSFSRPNGLMVHPETGMVHAGVEVFNSSEAQGY